MTNEFKGKHFAPEIILWCIRWYGSTPMSDANLSEMLAERGISVNRSTIYRWFVEFAPWQLDETYVKVKGKWFYLYRAINKQGQTLDFYFSKKRHRYSAYQCLKRCLRYSSKEKSDSLRR